MKFEGCSVCTNLYDVVQEKRKLGENKIWKSKSPGVSKKHENISEEKFPFGEIAPQTLCEES